PPGGLAEQLVQLLGQQGALHLLQHHRRQTAAAAGLEIEGALPGLADRAHDEPLRRLKRVHLVAHAPTLPPLVAPAPPPTTASDGSPAAGSKRRSPVSPRRRRNGRVGV